MRDYNLTRFAVANRRTIQKKKEIEKDSKYLHTSFP